MYSQGVLSQPDNYLIYVYIRQENEPEQRPSASNEPHESEGASTSAAENQQEEGEDNNDQEEENKEEGEAVLTEEDLIQQSQAEYDSGRYSPALLTTAELPLDTHTITPEEDIHRLQLARRQLQVTGKIHSQCTAGLILEFKDIFN